MAHTLFALLTLVFELYIWYYNTIRIFLDFSAGLRHNTHAKFIKP